MNDPLLAAAYRLWDATYELDRQRGDASASDWAAGQVRGLIRGSVEDPKRVEMLAEAMEVYLGATPRLEGSSHVPRRPPLQAEIT